jgi:alcohol dehydrogenase class IV
MSGLRNVRVAEFSGWGECPTDTDAESLARELSRFRPEAIVAVGGGSIIDLGKASRRRGCPEALLAAVPTTAGSGSEATPYASLLIRNNTGPQKISENFPEQVPRVVVLDPFALEGLPARQKAISGMDVIAQSIESYWSLRNTPRSDKLSLRALALACEHLVPYWRGSEGSAKWMQWAAYLAGGAIAITTTNACHAISYPLTTRFKIPHGWAAGLTLPAMLRWNRDWLGPKAAALGGAIGCSCPDDCADQIESIQRSLGLPVRLREWGVNEADLPAIIANSYRPDRVFGNPRPIAPFELEDVLRGVF